jgi:hypothetical protein
MIPLMPKSIPRCLTVCIWLAGMACPASAVASPDDARTQERDVATGIGLKVRALRIDGTTVEGTWVRIDKTNNLALAAENGPIALPLDELLRITFHSEATIPTPQRTDEEKPETQGKVLRAVLDLADGGHLDARLTDMHGETIVIDSALGHDVAVKLERLAGMQLSHDPTYQAARRAYLDALSRRRPAEDVLITLDVEDPRVLPGRIERLAEHPDEPKFIIDFMFGGRSRTVRFDRLFGIVLAAGVAEGPAFPATFEMRDGAVFSGRIMESGSATLIASTSLDTTASIKLDQLRSIRLRSDRVVYVSDLPITSERTEGILHRPWPVRKDRNVMGGPLSIAGRSFEKGIGCHSLTELRYKLEGHYESFAATIGIDDHVRPGGAVVFRVLGEGDVIWESGPVTGRDEPQDIVMDVTGVRELTLLVDYGEGLDLSDHANWGAARLIRPANSPPGVQ